MNYDLIVRGGHVIDPAHGVDAVCDLAIKAGRIAAIEPTIAPTAARQVIDARGKLVTPGLIDTHAHVFEFVTGRFGLEADLCGVHSGVTTLIDQGGPSCITLPAFRRHVIESKRSRVYTYLSSYLVGGMEGHYYPSLHQPDCMEVDATVRSINENRDRVIGIKAHAEIGGFSRWGLGAMQKAADMGRESGVPVYIHFGQLWPVSEGGRYQDESDPDQVLDRVVPLLKAGDILAHPFTRHPGGFVNRHGRVHAIVREAMQMGLKVDVGHGSHFSFNMARIALDAGIMPDTLGADMHGYNTKVPDPALAGTPESHPDKEHMFFGAVRFSLVSAMSAMLALGVSIEQVVAMASWNPQRYFGLPADLGHLGVGAAADVTVLNDERGRFVLRDNENTQLVADRVLTPAFCLLAGERFDAHASILPMMQAA